MRVRGEMKYRNDRIKSKHMKMRRVREGDGKRDREGS